MAIQKSTPSVKKIVENEGENKTMTGTTQKESKRRKIFNAAGYAVGSVALFSAACIALPAMLSHISGALYKSSLKKANHDDDDWGPVLERKEIPSEPEQPAQAELPKEEGTNGDQY